METILQVRDLKKTFHLSKKQQKLEPDHAKLKVAVNGVSFDAYKGQIFAILGPNGAGKTTTLRMLSTLIKPDGGDCIVDGVSINSDPAKVRGKIGFLTSELKLEEFFTPNYIFDFFAKLHGVSEEEKNKQKEYLFGIFGINQFAEVKIANLSTGMKQKVSIAVSLAHDPDIIIFDEPTNGLDIITAKVVTDFLISLKEKGKTIIISTHIFNVVEKIADRVGIIVNGKMVVCDTLASITEQKTLEDVFFDIYVKEVQQDEV